MKVGDELMLAPDLRPMGDGKDTPVPPPCRVVYIHPERRFYTVEFRSDVGETWRETRYFKASDRGREGK